MPIKNLPFAVFSLCALFAGAIADNPISNYHYLADPAAAASDSVFYILTDSDDPAGSNGYTIKSLYAFSSRDMKNWTDHGIVFEAKREYDNINDIWASGIAVRDGMFYIVYPDGGGGGVGLVVSRNIDGPYENPVPGNKKLINNWGGGLADCDGIAWCFDPAIFFDDDGAGYFTFGGGKSDARPAADGNNNIFNLYRFDSDMKGFDLDSKVELKFGGPRAMEASYIHKKGSLYYLTYSTADLRIAYATSDKVTGPYSYQGIFMDNPNINGKNINAYNNNHHGIAPFKGKWYAVYHDRRLVQASEHPASLGVENPEPAYHRSVSIDEFTYSGNAMDKLVYTNEGPKQIESFDPYRTYPALTSSRQRNIRSRTDWTRGKPVSHVLTPYASKDSWIRVSGVDFKNGAASFFVKASSIAAGNRVEIRTGSSSGTLAGSCEIPQTGSWNAYETVSCDISGLSGSVEELFIVFQGAADSTMGILEWGFSEKNLTPQTPFGGTASAIPGKIEAENFDEGGAGNAYQDSDAENKGGANVRPGEGVDIAEIGTSEYALAYTIAGEWLEYTVSVQSPGEYALTVRYAAGGAGSSVRLFIDGEPLADTVFFPVTKADAWTEYAELAAGNVSLPAGEHVLKLCVTGSYANIDWIRFEKPGGTTVIQKTLALVGNSAETLDVFDLNGKRIYTFEANLRDAVNAWKDIARRENRFGMHIVRSRLGKKSFPVYVER